MPVGQPLTGTQQELPFCHSEYNRGNLMQVLSYKDVRRAKNKTKQKQLGQKAQKEEGILQQLRHRHCWQSLEPWRACPAKVRTVQRGASQQKSLKPRIPAARDIIHNRERWKDTLACPFFSPSKSPTSNSYWLNLAGS